MCESAGPDTLSSWNVTTKFEFRRSGPANFRRHLTLIFVFGAFHFVFDYMYYIVIISTPALISVKITKSNKISHNYYNTIYNNKNVEILDFRMFSLPVLYLFLRTPFSFSPAKSLLHLLCIVITMPFPGSEYWHFRCGAWVVVARTCPCCSLQLLSVECSRSALCIRPKKWVNFLKQVLQFYCFFFEISFKILNFFCQFVKSKLVLSRCTSQLRNILTR